MTAYKVAIAFSNRPEPIIPAPDSVDFTSQSSNDGQLDLNINPITITAISVESDSVSPPAPGEQLSFFWG